MQYTYTHDALRHADSSTYRPPVFSSADPQSKVKADSVIERIYCTHYNMEDTVRLVLVLVLVLKFIDFRAGVGVGVGTGICVAV
jgi:hypothetical protein